MVMLSCDDMRARFAAALSDMYRREVPQYGTLLKLVSEINTEEKYEMGPCCDTKERVEVERHGAIRLGSAAELAMMRRLFAVMGMYPVGYYDLTVAGLPVHATGFRPIQEDSLQRNPFRVFTSLLRLDLIQDENLRAKAKSILEQRQIFTPRCIELIKGFEASHSFSKETAQEFLNEALETFRWHESSTVDMATYRDLEASHPLIADIVCFKGPHINHLTPRVLHIDKAQAAMQQHGLQAKEVVEGPPPRTNLILLRQTSFLAVEESIAFSDGSEKGGKHRARFGEIEQRGAALTPKGRRLYDELLARFLRAAEGKDASTRQELLAQHFAEFPDDLETLRRQGLAYFRYGLGTPRRAVSNPTNMDDLVSSGVLTYETITYEDFLPASAAGIFRSNLGACKTNSEVQSSDQGEFEKAMGCSVQDPFELYSNIEKSSITECLEVLKRVSWRSEYGTQGYSDMKL
ncbi:hypothetical protein K4F52_002825 [Lecanicillium sp. MT-2017a]|nr:hypothetical protein K4F52_002825 [Lecanicillium sp. MT-2017a]